MTRSDIHIGIKGHNLEKAANLPFLNKDLDFYVDNDGFASWGDPRDKAGNDKDTFHVVIRCTDVPKAFGTIRSVFDIDKDLVNFEDATHPDHRELTISYPKDKVVVTEVEDWSHVLSAHAFI
jgi:hypothetical protein